MASGPSWTLEARRLDHLVEAFGYRLVEPDGRRMLPDALAAAGVAGPDVGRLQRIGALDVGGRTVRLADVSVHRPGQRVALVMDTRLCDAVYALAEGADLLVVESTFLDEDADLARAYGHLTARQAATVAAECGVRRLVLTHFSQRYPPTPRGSGTRRPRCSPATWWWRRTWRRCRCPAGADAQRTPPEP